MMSLTNALVELEEETLAELTEQYQNEDTAEIINAYSAGLYEVAARYNTGSYFISDLLAALGIAASGLKPLVAQVQGHDEATFDVDRKLNLAVGRLDSAVALMCTKVLSELRSWPSLAVGHVHLQVAEELQGLFWFIRLKRT